MENKVIKANFSIGLMHEFTLALIKAGWEYSDVQEFIKKPNLLDDVPGLYDGTKEIRDRIHRIDPNTSLEKRDFCPELEVKSHKSMKPFNWNDCRLRLFTVPERDVMNQLTTKEYLDEFKKTGGTAFNASVLMYLLEYPAIIPNFWKEVNHHPRNIFFPETIFTDKENNEYILSMHCVFNKWEVMAWRNCGPYNHYHGIPYLTK